MTSRSPQRSQTHFGGGRGVFTGEGAAGIAGVSFGSGFWVNPANPAEIPPLITGEAETTGGRRAALIPPSLLSL